MKYLVKRLNVFRDNEFIGTFVKNNNGDVDFAYARQHDSFNISLSLPRDQNGNVDPQSQRSAINYLDGLLPDNPRVREHWATLLHVPNTPFDLVGAMGEDVAGALVIVPEGTSVSAITPTIRATVDDIASRIATAQHNQDIWLDPDLIGKVRMSLAGAQAKFSLARVNGQWFFPSAATPSTHIFKPPNEKDYPGVVELEVGTLNLAQRLGIPAAHSDVVHVRGNKCFLTRRFDRETLPNGQAKRLHVEDTTQALGLGSDQKYRITTQQIVKLLKKHTPEEDVYSFVRMLAFNAAIGNADAHGKNYTLLLHGDTPRLAPLYDSVPTAFWPTLHRQLAMRIAGVRYPQELSLAHWVKFAHTHTLDVDRVISTVKHINLGVVDQAHDTYAAAGVTSESLKRIDALVSETTRNMHKPRNSKPQRLLEENVKPKPSEIERVTNSHLSGVICSRNVDPPSF